MLVKVSSATNQVLPFANGNLTLSIRILVYFTSRTRAGNKRAPQAGGSKGHLAEDEPGSQAYLGSPLSHDQELIHCPATGTQEKLVEP